MIGASLIAAMLATQVPAAASTPEAVEALNEASEAACLRAARLDDARISAPSRFSDDLMIEARIVDGRAPEGAGEGERTSLLCLYHRGTGRAETRPFDAGQPRLHSRQVRGVWWHAVDIGGSAPIGEELVTMSLGEDGRVAGRSGCNLYSALYRLDGEAIEVVWPMTGTRRACVPAVMDQELRFREIVLNARALRLQDDGSLVLTDREGDTVRFMRAEGRMQATD